MTAGRWDPSLIVGAASSAVRVSSRSSRSSSSSASLCAMRRSISAALSPLGPGLWKRRFPSLRSCSRVDLDSRSKSKLTESGMLGWVRWSVGSINAPRQAHGHRETPSSVYASTQRSLVAPFLTLAPARRDSTCRSPLRAVLRVITTSRWSLSTAPRRDGSPYGRVPVLLPWPASDDSTRPTARGIITRFRRGGGGRRRSTRRVPLLDDRRSEPLPVIPIGPGLDGAAQPGRPLGEPIDRERPESRDPRLLERRFYLAVQPRLEPVVLGHHQPFGRRSAPVAALDRLPVVGVEVLHDRVGSVEQPHAALPEAPAEVEVLVVEDEVGVETACGQEEFPLQRHVARVEARPTCLPVTLQLEEAVVEH